jgi:hypothetical protein
LIIKYANITFLGKEVQNLGDNIQLSAIEKLYKYMGVAEEEIIKIPYTELSTWHDENGEKVILPINFPFLEYKEKGIANTFSEDIIPIFLGLTLLKSRFSIDEIDYLKQYEPIGCRDEFTYQNLKKAGLKVWLNGCMTLTMFPNRQIEGSKKSVFLVDISDQLREFIPQEFIPYIRECSQIVKITNSGNIKEITRQRYEQYRDEAKLIITSRLHCAIPCLAMGIPVILAVEKVSFRFSWVEKLLPIYTPDTFHKINWNPDLVDVDNIKNKLLENATYRIQRRSQNTALINEITNFYLERERKPYFVEGFSETIDYIRNNWNKNKIVKYSFWGISYLSELIDDYIKENYPNAILLNAFDKYRKLCFRGIYTLPISEIETEKLKDMEVFITASVVTQEAKIIFSKIGKDDGFFLCYSDIMKATGTNF